MCTLKQLYMLAMLWHTGLAIALPHPACHQVDSAISKRIIPELFTRNIPEWFPSLQPRGDRYKEPAIRRHSLLAQAHTDNLLNNQHSGTKRDRKGSPILQPFVPTPGLAKPSRKAPSNSQRGAGKGLLGQPNYDSTSGSDRSQRTITSGYTTANSHSATSRDSSASDHDQHDACPAGKEKDGVDHSKGKSMPVKESSRDMLPPPPRPPSHTAIGYPVGNRRPVYGFPMIPLHEVAEQPVPGSHKEPGSDLESYLERRSTDNDLTTSIFLARRGSSQGSSTGTAGPMVRGTDGPDRATQTTATPSYTFSRSTDESLSMTTGGPANRIQALWHHQAQPGGRLRARIREAVRIEALRREAQQQSPNTSIPPSSSTAAIPQNDQRSRSSSPARPSRMERRSVLVSRTPGNPGEEEHKSPPPVLSNHDGEPPSHRNTMPQARPFSWPSMLPHVAQPSGSFSVAPDPVAEAALRNAALRVLQARRGSQSGRPPFPNGQRPGTTFAPLSPTSEALRRGPLASTRSENSSPEQSPRALSPSSRQQ